MSLIAISTGGQVTTLHTIGTMPSEILLSAAARGQINHDRLEVVVPDQDRVPGHAAEGGARQHTRAGRRVPEQSAHHRGGHIRKVDEVHENCTPHPGPDGEQSGP